MRSGWGDVWEFPNRRGKKQLLFQIMTMLEQRAPRRGRGSGWEGGAPVDVIGGAKGALRRYVPAPDAVEDEWELGSAGIQDEKSSERIGRRTELLHSGFLQVVSCKWSPSEIPCQGCDGVVTPPAPGTLQHQLEPESKVQVPGVKNVGGAGRSRVSSVADRK